jgi:hypothetical protein
MKAQRIMVTRAQLPALNAQLIRIEADGYIDHESPEGIGVIIFRRTPIAAGIRRMLREGKV